MKGSVQLFVLAGFIFLGTGGLAPGQVAINVSPALPSDIAGGAPNATLQQAASFAWQEFIALNWPAMAGQRDVADPVQKFGASTGPGPLVWQTFRGKVEIFNFTKDAAGELAPPGYSTTAPDLGYNTPPAYFYETQSVPACHGQAAPASPAWINVDETTQIGLGLIALHIIQKTPSAPAFIYATFEQADNIRQPNATPVEDPDGNVIQPITPPVAPTTPALA
jgi:hypothetical protein